MVFNWNPQISTSEQRIHCSWQFRAASIDQHLNLTFTNLNIAPSENCQNSYLEVADGEILPWQRPIRYCGPQTHMPLTFESTSDMMSVKYIGAIPSGTVFQMKYQSVGCNRTYQGASGRITSPGFPGTYPENQQCFSIVRGPEGTKLALYFEFLDIEAHSSCIYDFLEVLNGSDSNSPRIARFCNNASLPNPIFFTGNQAALRFKSDASLPGRGYAITFTSMPQSNSPESTLIIHLIVLFQLLAVEER